MNVLMTGSTGYLGSRLASRLSSEGYKVAALKRKKSSLKKLENIKDNLIFFDTEDTDYSQLFQNTALMWYYIVRPAMAIKEKAFQRCLKAILYFHQRY